MTTQTLNAVHVFEAAGLGLAPYKLIGVNEKTHMGRPGSCCDFCATSIRYEFWLVSADNRRFKVGSDCIEKSGDQGLINASQGLVKERKTEQRVVKKQAQKLSRAAQKRQDVIDWLLVQDAQHPTLAPLSKVLAENPSDRPYDHRILNDIANKLWYFGSLSFKQVDLVRKIVADLQNPAPEAPKTPVPTGRMEITGNILSAKDQETFYNNRVGYIWKMLVLDDRGFKVWGTIPSTGVKDSEPYKGQRVRFTAAVEPSRNDPNFGFYKRPTQCKYLGRWDNWTADDYDDQDVTTIPSTIA